MSHKPATLTVPERIPMKTDYDRHLGKDVTIFLTNGVKLTGVVAILEPKSLWLTREGQGQSVFYPSIATIMPKSEAPGNHL